MDTETIDRLFLELSQFTKATTKKELDLIEENEKLKKRIDNLVQELNLLRERELIGK